MCACVLCNCTESGGNPVSSDNRALAQATGRMLGILPYASGVGWDQVWECSWPLVPRFREIRARGMVGQQRSVKDQVAIFSLKGIVLWRMLEHGNGGTWWYPNRCCLGWQEYHFAFTLKPVCIIKPVCHPQIIYPLKLKCRHAIPLHFLSKAIHIYSVLTINHTDWIGWKLYCNVFNVICSYLSGMDFDLFHNV